MTSQVDSPAERLGQVANHILQQTMKFVTVNLQNSEELKKKLKNFQVQDSHIIMTADIKSLYTNVPLDHGVEVVSDFVKQHMTDIDMLGISFDDFKTILKTVTQSGYFRFDDSYYKQKDGLGMGIKAAPPFAIIYVYLTVEKPLLESDFTYALVQQDEVERPTNMITVELWDRYVDDCITIGKGSEHDADVLFSYINKLNPHIQFTYEVSTTQVDFLDLTIYLSPTTGTVEHELFVKPTNLGIFLNFRSGHPKSTILNSAKNELKRAMNNGSTSQHIDKGVKKIKEMLKDNDFPDNIIQKLHKEASKDRKAHTERKDMQYLCLPYVDEQHKRKVYQILRTNNLLDNTKVTFLPDNKLKDTLSKSALRTTKCNKQSDSTCYDCNQLCMKKNITYQLKCNLCDKKYVGETGRFKRNRCWEHYKSVINSNRSTAMGKHYLEDHPQATIPDHPFEFTVLKTCKDYTDRMIWQSFHINKLTPALNTQLSFETDDWQKTTWTLL